jgi:2-oxoglutarate ferredoxin oxidoreductase subunit gamma
MKDRVEIVASGFGGQGIVRLGQIIGEAAVKQGLHVTMLKSHGTEMRGGYVRSQVVFSKNLIDSPMCESPDYFVALSSSAYNRFKDTVLDSGLIIYDPGFVEKIDKDMGLENFGRPIFANSIVLGAMAKLIDGLEKEKILESLLDIIPKYQEENKDAFQFGYDYV